MKNIMLEAYEISGARKLLLKLQQDYLMSLVPSVKCKCRSFDGRELKEFFPIPVKYRKIVGEGMMRFLLSDMENIRRYIYEDAKLSMKFTYDKKGKPVKCDVYIDKK